MRISQILEKIFMPRKCILCDDLVEHESSVPFCEECSLEWLSNLDMLCEKCGFDCDYCTCLPDKVREISSSLATFGVFYTPNVQTPANRVVYRLKRDYNFEVIRFCAEIMHKKIIKLCAKHSINYKDFVVTYPNRRRKSERKYGYDHAKLLAKELAKKLGVDVIECFENVGKKEQKALDKTDRLHNASESYILIDNIDIKGKSIFLVDDVMTSGATLNICAKKLIFAGAKRVIPVAFAKDTKPNTSNFNE